MPTTVIFDLGGVLIDWDPRHLYRKLFDGDDAAMEEFIATIVTSAWNERQDAGRPFAEGVALLIEEHPSQAALIEAYRTRWSEMLGGAFADTVEIVAELRAAGVPLYAITNWSAETFPMARRRFPFLDWFAGIVVSGEERITKPDPRLFQVLFERYAISPERALFIDDVERNVAAAEKLGLRAIRFTGAAALRRDLEALELLRPHAVHRK